MGYEDVKWAYDQFWTQRRAIQERQRRELEQELAPERQELRDAIAKARADGLTVQDLADELGLKNRNFLYLVMNDQPLVELDPERRKIARSPSLSGKEPKKRKDKEATTHLSYSIKNTEAGIFEVRVTSVEPFWDKHYTVSRVDGVIVDIPEDWYMDSENADFYRDLIKAVENG